MLLAYPAHGVKATITRCKATDLVWAPNKTTVEIHSAVMEYYEAYDRAVVLTQGMANVTMIVPAQDWATRFTELQGMFRPWALALITNFPDCFTNMANCWAAIIDEASRQAAGRRMGAGGRVLSLARRSSPPIPCRWVSLTASTTWLSSSTTILRTGTRSSVVASLHLVVRRAAGAVEIRVICAVTAHFRP